MIHRRVSDNRTMSHLPSVYREYYDDNVFINNGQYDVIDFIHPILQPLPRDFCLIRYILIYGSICPSTYFVFLFHFHLVFCRCIYLYSPLFDVLMLPYFSLYLFCTRYCLVYRILCKLFSFQ